MNTKNMRFVLPPALAKPLTLRPDDLAIAGAKSTELTAEQRQRLARCARRAYDAQVALGLTETDAFDAWRHVQVEALTGQPGLRELKQRDYGRTMARMIELAGGTPYKKEWHAANKPDGRDDADRARHALRDECTKQADAFGGAAQADAYATTLLAKIHKTDWMSATAKQLWQVLFTVRNRARSKTHANAPARAVAANPCADTESSTEAASPRFPAALQLSGPVGGGAGSEKRNK